MTARRAVLLVMGLSCLAVIVGGAWYGFAPAPGLNLARFEDLRSAGRFKAAAEVLQAHLRRSPRDDEARLLLAQLLLDQPATTGEDDSEDERTTEVLGLLDRIDPTKLSVAESALVALYRGKALYALGDWDGSERALARAIELDPLVPEASWGLLDQYYLEGRATEAQALALRMHGIEPDARDRLQFLLELIRQDAQPPDPASMVEVLKPVVAAKPGQVRPTLTLGLSLVRSNRIDEGLEVLRRFVEANPESAEGWDALLAGIDAAGRPEVFVETFERLPESLVGVPRFARHRARVAQEARDWAAAVEAYRAAIEHDPLDSTLVYRLGLALRNAGRAEEGERILEREAVFKTGMAEVRALYNEANGNPALGRVADVDLYKRLGDLRERMLRPAEARAWYALALEAVPGDPELAATVERLAIVGDGTTH